MTDNIGNDPLANLVGEGAEQTPLDDLFNDQMQEAVAQADPGTSVVRVVTTTGSTNVPVDPAHTVGAVPGYTVAEILALAGLYVQAGSVYWVGGAAVATDYVVSPGASITVVGNAKGG